MLVLIIANSHFCNWFFRICHHNWELKQCSLVVNNQFMESTVSTISLRNSACLPTKTSVSGVWLNPLSPGCAKDLIFLLCILELIIKQMNFGHPIIRAEHGQVKNTDFSDIADFSSNFCKSMFSIFTIGEYRKHWCLKISDFWNPYFQYTPDRCFDIHYRGISKTRIYKSWRKKSGIHIFDLAGRTLENPYVCGHLQWPKWVKVKIPCRICVICLDCSANSTQTKFVQTSGQNNPYC